MAMIVLKPFFMMPIQLLLEILDQIGHSREKLSQGERRSLTGYAEPGNLMALMVPSVSGRSTLLDALAGHLTANAFLSDSIAARQIAPLAPRDLITYVKHDGNLIGTLTVRETIAYSARLRLPNSMPWSQKQALVDGTITDLQDCADTVIENWHLRGISGSEKSRVSIALEILMGRDCSSSMNPPVALIGLILSCFISFTLFANLKLICFSTRN